MTTHESYFARTGRRLVNCRVAYLVTNRHGSHVERSGGAWGVPEQAMRYAVERAATTCHEYDGVEYRVLGVAVRDVETGEEWLYGLAG